MKGFKFRFQTLLDHRERLVNSLQSQLAEVRRCIEQEEQRLSGLRSLQQECLTELHIIEKNGLDPEVCNLYHCYLQHLKCLELCCIKRITELNQLHDERRTLLVEADKKKKVVNKIREKDQKLFVQTVNQQETKFFDEVGANRSQRTRLQNSPR